VANERHKPVYAVEFKAPHKMTIPELVAGLHQIFVQCQRSSASAPLLSPFLCLSHAWCSLVVEVSVHPEDSFAPSCSPVKFRDTVDNFVEMVIKALQDDECLRQEFGIQGRVTFYDRSNPSETSLENCLNDISTKLSTVSRSKFRREASE
jgi:hypothetical protein